jgi:hypothetical protein
VCLHSAVHRIGEHEYHSSCSMRNVEELTAMTGAR